MPLHLSSRQRRYAAAIGAAALAASGLVSMVASAAPASATATDLLANPGFEAADLSGWTCDAGTSAIVTSPVHSGSYALSGTPTSSDDAACTQTVSVQPSTAYTLSGYVEGSYVYLGVTGGTDIWTPSATSWQQLTTSFTTGASQTSVQVYVHGWYAQPEYFADDLALTGPAGPTPSSGPSSGSPSPSPSTTPTPTPTSSGSPSPSGGGTPTSTPTGTGGNSGFNQSDIDAAVAAPLIAFSAPTSSNPRPGTSATVIHEAAVLYYLALVDLQDPGAKASNGTTVDSALIKQVGNLVAGGNEPDADGGLEGWSAAPVAQALLLLKHGPAFAELTSAVQNKVSLLMAAMGYGGNYAYNDANNFSSGICGFGNFAKTNNPNYEDGYVDVELAAIQYFGPSTWNSMLASFNDATEASALNAAGLTNAGGCFTTAGSAANTAIEHAWLWKGLAASSEMALWSRLASDAFDHTVVSSVTGTSNGASVTARIADGSTSPEQGQFGMAHEFDSTDSGGLRSSALYVFEGWMNVTGSRVAMTVTGDFSCSSATAAPQYKVGTEDLIYKLNHGYISYAQSQNGVLVNDTGDPSGDGPVAKGWSFDDDAYNVDIAGQSC